MVIDAPNVKDRSGLALGSLAIVTHFTTLDGTTNTWIGDMRVTVVGDWRNAANWSLGRVPGPSDLVSISIPNNRFVSFGAGSVAVKSLQISGGTLMIQGGTLTVNEASQADRIQISGGRLEGAGDITIAKSFALTSGILSGAGQLRIASGATAELTSENSAVLDARTIIVEGLLKGLSGVVAMRYARSPVIEVRQGGVFTAGNGFGMSSADGLVGRLDLFGKFTTEVGASVTIGLEIIVMPGATFTPLAGRLELQGGGRFSTPLNTSVDTIVYLRGPKDGTVPTPIYTFPAGVTHKLDGPLLVGGGRVVLGGDVRVRLLDFVYDNLGLRLGSLVVDGILTVTEQMGSIDPSVFGIHQFSILNGGVIEGRGQVTIEAQAVYKPSLQKFRGVTIINKGTLDLTRSGLGLGKEAVFEHLGTIAQTPSQFGDYSYAQIEPASYPNDINAPMDRGTFNARVPLLFQGTMRFGVVLNLFAGLTVINGYPLNPSSNNFYIDLLGGGTMHGPINIPRGVDFNLRDPGLSSRDPREYDNIYTMSADSQIQIEGDLHVWFSSLIVNTNVSTGMLHFVGYKQNSKFENIPSNSITGPGNIDITRKMYWYAGRIATTGKVTIQPNASLQLAGTNFETVLDGTTLIHQGNSLDSDTSGQITLAGGALIRNEGAFRRAIVYPDILSGVGGGRIENYGDWFFGNVGGGFGESTVDVPFVNFGTLRIENPGNGSVDALRFSSLDNNGTLIIAAHLFAGRKSVEVRGDYHQSATASLRIELSSDKPQGNQLYAGLLNITGQASLAGKLEIDFVALDSHNYADRPTVGEVYPLLVFASKFGDFILVSDVDPLDGIAYNIVNTATTMNAAAIVQPQPLHATSIRSNNQLATVPSMAQLSSVTHEAIARWAASGLDLARLNRMRNAEFQVADLAGSLLGLTEGNQVTIDSDAAGWGWFIDATPEDDDEFEFLAKDVLQAKLNSQAESKMDLLTVVMHELGHIVGLDDEGNQDTSSQSLMHMSLDPHLRKRIRTAD